MGEALATWDHYVVPSRDLEIAIRAQARHTPRITRFPLIGTDDNGEDILLLRPKRCIAVFDVSSRRDRILSKLVYPPSIVSAKWVIKFHEDLAYCAKKIGCYLVVKQKREFSSSVHPKYRRFIQNMAEQDFVIFVNPRVAAARVAAKCAVTVALPFSTPAVYGRALGKPSVFYDPTGKIARHCTKFHDVPVASGRESLLAWLENAIREGSLGKSDPDQLT